MLTMTEREEAIDDCRYALKLDGGNGTFAALNQHIALWTHPYANGEVDEYILTIREIAEKFGTPMCLIKEV